MLFFVRIVDAAGVILLPLYGEIGDSTFAQLSIIQWKWEGAKAAPLPPPTLSALSPQSIFSKPR